MRFVHSPWYFAGLAGVLFPVCQGQEQHAQGIWCWGRRGTGLQQEKTLHQGPLDQWLCNRLPLPRADRKGQRKKVGTSLRMWEWPWSLTKPCFHAFLHKGEIEKVLSFWWYMRYSLIIWLSELKLFKKKTSKSKCLQNLNHWFGDCK